MLFTYRYVNHPIERFQGYLDHLVKEVWCKPDGDYSVDLLHPELRQIVEAIFEDEAITKDHLDGPIREIYEIFRVQLSSVQRQQISSWYDINNDVEALCAGAPGNAPGTYANIRAIDATLEEKLRTFCNSLFKEVIHLRAVTSRIGELEAHYKAFVGVNRSDRCPYCGYGYIKGTHQTKRDAYDHFLPKGTYPFNSVNFRNLAPMCNECNSSYKLAKDPISGSGGIRRKAFYSYDTVSPDIRVRVTLSTSDVFNLQPDDIALELASAGREDEVEAWKDVFGVEERYKAKFCGESDGKVWLQQIIEESANVSMTQDELLAVKFMIADKYPYTDSNFLRKPFLEACRNAKIL